MARRRLLSSEQWAGFLAAPADERDILRYYTLSREDINLIAGKRTPHRRLGFALVHCYLHRPSQVLEQHEDPPPALIEFVAEQVGARPADLAHYRRRDTCRRQHLAELLDRTGQPPFDRTMFRDVAAWLLPIAQVKRDPMARPEQLRERLPTLRHLTRPIADIEAQARCVVTQITAALPSGYAAAVAGCSSEVGSGSLPMASLASVALTIRAIGQGSRSALRALARGFRGLPVPVIGRFAEGSFWLDLRCLDDEAGLVAQLSGLREALEMAT